jgi:hypothetical protein
MSNQRTAGRARYAPAKQSGPRFGKRRRRLEIRARHQAQGRKFARWVQDRYQTPDNLQHVDPRKLLARLWHFWHNLGCP